MKTDPIYGALTALASADLPAEIVRISLRMALDAAKTNEHVVLIYDDDETIRSMRIR